MFMGYSIDRWIGLGEYIIILGVLTLFVWIVSVQLVKATCKNKKRRKRY